MSKYVPTKQVIKAIRDSLALIDNFSAHDKVKKKHPQLGNFMKEACKEETSMSSKYLFGEELKKKLNERSNTMKALMRL